MWSQVKLATSSHHPVLQTRLFGGSVNPVSYDAVLPQQVGYSESDIERMRMRLQIQTYMSHHQMQTQWQSVGDPTQADVEEETLEAERPN